MLSAKDGRIIKTFIKSSRINNSLRCESGVSGPEAVSTISIPTMPKVTEAPMNMLVAIFCIL